MSTAILKNQRILTTLPLEETFWELEIYEEVIKKDFEDVSNQERYKVDSCNKVKRKTDLYKNNHEEIEKHSKEVEMMVMNNNQRAFIGGALSDNGEDEVEKTKDETCLVTQAPDEICLGINLEPDEWIKDNGCSKHMTGTTHLGLWYPKGSGIETIVYADSNHAGDYIDSKSTSGVCTFMGCCLTSWFLKKQTALAISITKAEYVSARKACQQALWMKQALIDYGVRLDDIPIICDNKGAIDLSKNPVQHSRTKHIEIRHHFLRDNVLKGNISIEKVSSEDNIADILTKPLKCKPFNYLHLGLGMMEQID
ncbi:hypothetical protein Tco_0150009 [Tanacetum coccineum]